ncbi:hypothetical protein GCM10010466_39660 [Planomonospora alba]|uniref:Uncharacterized protein n=2 Tax=Planomonospora alba TaxID=161354 RepID=A0ABP6NDF2_9ACTN
MPPPMTSEAAAWIREHVLTLPWVTLNLPGRKCGCQLGRTHACRTGHHGDCVFIREPGPLLTHETEVYGPRAGNLRGSTVKVWLTCRWMCDCWCRHRLELDPAPAPGAAPADDQASLFDLDPPPPTSRSHQQ